MSKHQIVKNHFDNGEWQLCHVWDAVLKGWITQSEYEEITGSPYEQDRP